jgi:hypothetical protein
MEAREGLTMFGVTKRDLLWFAVLVAVLGLWWLNSREHSSAYQTLAAERNRLKAIATDKTEWKERAQYMGSLLRDENYKIDWTPAAPYVKFQYPNGKPPFPLSSAPEEVSTER